MDKIRGGGGGENVGQRHPGAGLKDQREQKARGAGWAREKKRGGGVKLGPSHSDCGP